MPADEGHRAPPRQKLKLEKYVSDGVGLPTLQDIVQELAKPGRDPREKFELFSFKDGVEKMEDLKPGMKLPGIVTNVTAFGAFVDIGVHQDGLVHVSHLADRFIKDASEVVKVSQKVMVTVTEVDLPRKRIALSMKANPEIGAAKEQRSSPAAPRPAAGKPGGFPARPPFNQNRGGSGGASLGGGGLGSLADAFDTSLKKK